jgi:hypothetical protein
MAHAAPVRPKINTKPTQPARSGAARAPGGPGKAGRPAKASARVGGDIRDSVRNSDRVVIEVGCGVTVYPARGPGDVWRAVWVEDGRRRYREAGTEARLAAKLEKVIERLTAGAANMERPGADLIAFYLSPDRLPADRQWSRKHAHTQARLCAVRHPGDRPPALPGHHHQPHAADRQRSTHPRRRRPGPGNDLRPRRRRDCRRIPGQPPAQRSALASRRPPPAPPRSAWPANRRCSSTPPTSPPPPTWAGSARPWPRGAAGTWTS